MKALHDKAELKQRNKAYKVTLEYCPETCDDVDDKFDTAKQILQHSGLFSTQEINYLHTLLDSLNTRIKDVGTRKLRQAFTTYVLENTKYKD